MDLPKSNFILDSGAFSADMQGTPVDVQKYMEFLRENNVQQYFGLDVIGDYKGTWENQRIMEENGFDPIPVYHADDPHYYLEKCIAEYEYFALGGMAGGVSEQTRQRFLDRCWEKICPPPSFLPKNRIHGLGLASPLLIARYPWYCMTEEDHTVLTKNGWKSLSELSIGTEILCFDKGKSFWDSIEKIPTFDVNNISIQRLHNRNMECMVTENHRWNVLSRGGKWKFKTIKEFASNDVIPRVGEYSFPTEKEFTDEQVSLLAWFWTDGTIKERGKYKNSSVVIYQSVKANPEKCTIIRNLLDLSNESYCEMKPAGGSGIIAFELYGEISKWILSIAPNKILPSDLPLRLTKEQTEFFIKNSVLADGTEGRLVRRKGWSISVSRNYKVDNLQVVRTMCLLLGIPTSINYNNGYCSLTSSSVDHIYIGNLIKQELDYSGKIWCVQVKSGSFFTKCKEKIYVTGNSVDTASGIHYGRYGIIIIPRKKGSGEPDYLSPPYSIYITERSTAKKIEGKHIMNVAKPVREWIYSYIRSRGFAVGRVDIIDVVEGYELQENEKFTDKSRFKVERVVSDGIVSNGTLRDYFNIDFYMQMEKAIPKWPWAFKPTVKRLF